MSHPQDEQFFLQRQDQLFTTLQQLLQIPATQVKTTLNQTAQLITDVFSADKVDVFFYDPAIQTLVALGNSNTEMGRRQIAIGMDRLPVANGGRTVEVFLTGKSHIDGHVDQDSEELAGLRDGLGIVSQIATVFEVQARHRGVVVVVSATPDFFSEQDLHFLEAVSHWIGVVVDRAELVEQIKQEAQAHGQRLAAEELLTIMAHDLHNYLTPLKGNANLLERRASREGREQDLRLARAIEHTLGRFERVISNLLDVARLKQGIFSLTLQPVNLIDLVQEVVTAFRTPETQIQMQAPDEVILSADPDRLHQAIENLVANAVKYAPAHTPISVKLDVEQRAEHPWALLTVSNQGPALPSEILESLSEPFVAGKESTGLGLGLYLASKIAQAHGGTLILLSPEGQGVQALLSLPIEG